MLDSTQPLLRVNVERSADTAVIRLDGELDCATAGQVERTITELLDASTPPRRLLIDADRLSFVDVSGLTPLVQTVHRLPSGSTLQVRNARRQVIRVIRLLDLAEQLGLDV